MSLVSYYVSLLEVVSYTNGYNHSASVLAWHSSHPFCLCRNVPTTTNLVVGAKADVETSSPTIYGATLLADVVNAHTHDWEDLPIGGYLQRDLEIAVYIYRTLLFTYEVYTRLDVKPIGKTIISIYAHGVGLGAEIISCTETKAEATRILR